jgi:hypothetical protein
MPRRRSKTRIRVLLCCCLGAAGLWGRAAQPKLIRVEAAAQQAPAELAQIEESLRWTLLLRAVDGKMLGTHRQPVPFFPYRYLLPPGRHLLWVMSPAQILGAYPIPVGDIRCFTIDAELKADVVYRLVEDEREQRALLLRADSGEVVARGALVGKFFTGTRTCRWS